MRVRRSLDFIPKPSLSPLSPEYTCHTTQKAVDVSGSTLRARQGANPPYDDPCSRGVCMLHPSRVDRFQPLNRPQDRSRDKLKPRRAARAWSAGIEQSGTLDCDSSHRMAELNVSLPTFRGRLPGHSHTIINLTANQSHHQSHYHASNNASHSA